MVVLLGVLLFLPTFLIAESGATGAAIATGVVGGLVLLAVALPAYGALGAFNHGFWTLAYLRLKALPAPPR